MTPYQTAKEKGEMFYISSPCRHGHSSGKRYTSTKHCVECELLKTKKRRAENKQYFSEWIRNWRKANRELSREMYRRSAEKHREKRMASLRAYKKTHKAAMSALEMKRHCAMLQRFPKWANTEEIRAVYEAAERLRSETQIRYEVDHIIPLQGKLVSGLHVANNLQILTKSENTKKHNSFVI